MMSVGLNNPLRLHPVLSLALLKPQLLLDHAAACVDLMLAEAESEAQRWGQRGLWSALAAGCLLAASVLAGTSLMLWAALPPGSLPYPLALVVVPLLPVLPGLLAWRAVHRVRPPAFALLRQQLAGDLQLLREASAGAPAA